MYIRKGAQKHMHVKKWESEVYQFLKGTVGDVSSKGELEAFL